MSTLTQEELRQQLVRSCNMLGIVPALIPEPEVLQADLARIQCKTLAGIIAKLLTDAEPLLMVDCEGTTLKVREVGGDGAFRVVVEAI